ncbi:hypothetical protein EDM52_01490 [Brevibacillus invocatus]|uniref:Uncharacterized protein n=1 Tax=Brevibacillus invocatus TaxID=173959 RepID=A0A3M8CMN1_9BACL|nr:hypothetical protein [Brevibacillus invocatus]RNB76893.1 hypothetical protein EDM52_01490 [Brevibacillus invocatus]
MLAKMKREKFDAWQTELLGRACIEHVQQQVQGKSPQVKMEVYKELTAGQRALFMFHVLHDHAHPSVAEFVSWIAYTLDHFSYWIGIQAGLRYFEQEDILHLLEEMKVVLEERNQRLGIQMSQISVLDLEEDPSLIEEASRLYQRYQELSEGTLLRIGRTIRSNPGEFVTLCDGA